MLSYKSGILQSLEVKRYSNFSFAENTTYRLGGNAKFAYYPKNIPQAIKAAEECRSCGDETFIIGNGSNVLASDSGFGGAVISTKKLSGIVRLDNNRLFCLAGTPISKLLNYCKSHGLSGVEYLIKIPATVGGAAYMNAGAAGRYFGENIKKVLIYTDKKVYFNKNQCNFTYKHSTMRDINCLILAVVLQLEVKPVAEIEANLNYYSSLRKHLPKGRSCGCVFKNGDNYFAGELIEKAGLKGIRCGNAIVSFEHSNFIINEGDSSNDVKKLIELVKYMVKLKFKVGLEEEVVYIGDFNETYR
ncbi:MAG: UDP-N-acetylmuramate dehydrogenase [Candidatus Coproplasma sp.]